MEELEIEKNSSRRKVHIYKNTVVIWIKNITFQAVVENRKE